METEDEAFETPEYLKHPLIARYLHRAQHLLDDMDAEGNSDELPLEFLQIRGALTAVIGGILFDERLEEIDVILRMTFSDYYGPQTEDVIGSLTRLPLNSSN